MREWTILPRLERDSTFRPLEVMINGTRIECHDEYQCREIEGIVDKTLIENANRINKNADRRYYKPQQKIAVPDASYHSRSSNPTTQIPTASGAFGKLFLKCNHVSRWRGGGLDRFTGRSQSICKEKPTKDDRRNGQSEK